MLRAMCHSCKQDMAKAQAAFRACASPDQVYGHVLAAHDVALPPLRALVQVRAVASSCNQQFARAHAQLLHEIRQHSAHAPVAAGSAAMQGDNGQAPTGQGNAVHHATSVAAAGKTPVTSTRAERQRPDGTAPDASEAIEREVQATLPGTASAADVSLAAEHSRTEADEGSDDGTTTLGYAPAGRAAQQCLRAELSTVYLHLCRGAIAQLLDQAQRGSLLPPHALAMLQNLSELLHGGASSLIEAEVQYLERQLTKLNVVDGRHAPTDATALDYDFSQHADSAV